MATAQLLHFVVRDLTYTDIVTGYLVTCYTNNPCHLWLRYTTTIPQKHVHTKMVRGAPVGTYIDQCFVVWTDVEQNEAGDTYAHTFTLDPWPSCQRRWFYFWGTVGGVLSPSASAIFTKHRPFYLKVYPDPGSGLITCDGYVSRGPGPTSFQNLRTGPGTNSNTWGGFLYVQFRCWRVPNQWTNIHRPILTFDLTSIPKTNRIVEAYLHLDSAGAGDPCGNHPSVAVFSARPTAYNALQPSDYQAIGDTPLSNEIQFADYKGAGYNVFTFNAIGLIYLKPAKINAVAMRECKYDVGGATPNWVSDKTTWMDSWSRDHGPFGSSPYIIVGHAPPGA